MVRTPAPIRALSIPRAGARADVVWRSAISDDIQAVWDATPTLNALLARLSRADVQRAQTDADIDSKIATLLAGRTGDLWLAQRIRQGRLGTTAQTRPVEARFIQGTTDRKALVIAGVHGSERQGIEVHPERIISIHGTRHSGAGGVFYDPIRLTSADIARARSDARAMAFMQVPVEQQSTFEGQERLRQAEDRNFFSAMAAMVDRDRVLSLAAAAQIDAATAQITGREKRPLEREGEKTVDPTELKHRQAHPSVPGNVGASGNVDTGFWSGSTPGGVSLGGYASQRGISIFTVEPPLNLSTGDYPAALDKDVDDAERRVELEAYADAVRTVLLGS